MTMSKDSEDDNKEGGASSGEGGKSSGEVYFRYKDILSAGGRDDTLPANEIKRLLIVHQDLHKERVEKQKLTLKERKALKEGRSVTSTYTEAKMGRGGGSGQASPYKKHPITDKAQFSGIDRQVISLPTENQAETNLDAKEKLENQNRNVLRHSPKFNPKPRPY